MQRWVWTFLLARMWGCTCLSIIVRGERPALSHDMPLEESLTPLTAGSPLQHTTTTRHALLLTPPAVWVYCGDPVKCGKKHKECWLKHLVGGPVQLMLARQPPCSSHCPLFVPQQAPRLEGGMGVDSKQAREGPCSGLFVAVFVFRPHCCGLYMVLRMEPGRTHCFWAASPRCSAPHACWQAHPMLCMPASALHAVPCTYSCLQAHPAASKPMSHGPKVPWTSGTIDVDLNYDPRKAQGQVRRASAWLLTPGAACNAHF